MNNDEQITEELENQICNKMHELRIKLNNNPDVRLDKEYKKEIEYLRKKIWKLQKLGPDYDYLLIDLLDLEDPFYGYTPEEFAELGIDFN